MVRNKLRNAKTQLVAVAYARYSSNNQREESIDAQLRAIRSYCEKNNILLLDCFTDEALTGKNDNRDNFQRMINGIIKGNIVVDVVLVHKFNRFARNKFDSAFHKKRLKDVGVKVVSVSQQIDDTPEGEMLEGFLEVIDEYYSANLTLEVRKGLRENALNGKHTGGVPTLGLSIDESGKYVLNDQAKIVKRIFEEFASGLPKAHIVRNLNAEGHKNQHGNPFNTRTVYSILRNEKYIGNYVYTINGTETIRLDGIIDPIIDLDLWERVQRLNNQPVKARLRHQKTTYFLTGKTFCECCGMQICGNGSKRARNGDLIYYYKCVGNMKMKICSNPSLNKSWFEKNVLNSIINTVMTDKQIDVLSKMVLAELEELKQEPTVSTEALIAELKTLVKKEEKLVDLYLEGEVDKSTLDERNTALKSRKNEIQKEIEKRKAIGSVDDLSEGKIRDFITSYFNQIKKGYSENDTEFMISVFTAFVDKVIVNDKTITVYVITDFSIFGVGDNKPLAGAISRLSPITLQSTITRKTSLFGRNE